MLLIISQESSGKAILLNCCLLLELQELGIRIMEEFLLTTFIHLNLHVGVMCLSKIKVSVAPPEQQMFTHGDHL